MFCIKCGKEILDNDTNFCPKCGTPLDRMWEIDNNNSSSINSQPVEKKTPISKEKRKLNKKYIIVPIVAVLAVLLVLGAVKLIGGHVDETDITHGGEKVWISNGEEEWLYDYNWAELDESWEEFDPNAELKLGVDALTGSSRLKKDLVDEIARDYIEARLCPTHYNSDSYFEFCPSKSVKNAQKAWKKYLKDHKELSKMYIIVNGSKLYPYADDSFDKTAFMNPSTEFDLSFDDYNVFESAYMAENFYKSIYLAETLPDAMNVFYAYNLNAIGDAIYEATCNAQTDNTSVTGCHYFYYDDDPYSCDAIDFLIQYFPDSVYKGEDGSITVSTNEDGNYLVGYSINI